MIKAYIISFLRLSRILIATSAIHLKMKIRIVTKRVCPRVMRLRAMTILKVSF